MEEDETEIERSMGSSSGNVDENVNDSLPINE